MSDQIARGIASLAKKKVESILSTTGATSVSVDENVITLPSGSPVRVSNVGTVTAAKLHFEIPEGKIGKTGEQGKTGNKGEDGKNGIVIQSEEPFGKDEYKPLWIQPDEDGTLLFADEFEANIKQMAESAAKSADEAAAEAGSIPKDVAERLETLENIVYNELTAPVTVIGNPVQLDGLVGGLPLKITADIVATQAGSGDPSPDNVRKISGLDKLIVTANGISHEIALPEIVYGLSAYPAVADLNKGKLTKHQTVIKVFDGTENWAVPGTVIAGYSNYRISNFFSEIPIAFMCSHFVSRLNIYYTTAPYGNRATQYPGTTQLIIQVSNGVADSQGQTSVTAWKAYLAAQYAAGTPVTIVYALTTEQTLTIEPVEILSLSGTNTVYTNGGGNVSVEGRQGWKSQIDKLSYAIIGLGGII